MGCTETNTEGSGEHQTVHRAVERPPEGAWSALGGLQSKLKGQADGPGGASTQTGAPGDNERQTEASGGANDRGNH